MVTYLSSKQEEIVDLSKIADTSVSPSQAEWENWCQRMSGLEPNLNYDSVRHSLAENNYNTENNNLLEASQQSINEGADIHSVIDQMQQYNNVYNYDDDNTSLEVTAADQAVADTYAKNLMTYSNTQNDSDEIVADPALFAEKYTIWSKLLKETRDGITGMPAWKKFGSWVTRAVLPQVVYNAEDAAAWQQGTKGLVYASSTELRKDQKEAIWKDLNDTAITPKQFNDKYTDMLATMVANEDWSTVSDFLDAMENGGYVLDDVAFLGEAVAGAKYASKVIKGPTTETKLAKITGDIEKYKDLTKVSIDKGDVAFKTEELSTTAVQPVSGDGATISLAKRVENEVAEQLSTTINNKELTDLLVRTRTEGAINAEDAKTCTEIAKRKFIDEYRGELTSEADVLSATPMQDSLTGSWKVDYIIGAGSKNDTAMSLEGAKQYAIKLGLPEDDYTLVKGTGEGWYIKLTRDLEDGMTGKTLESDEEVSIGLKRLFTGVLNVSEEHHTRDAVTERFNIAFRTQNKTAYEKVNRLNKKQKKTFQHIVEYGQDLDGGKGRTLTKEELEYLDVDKATQDAYYAYIDQENLAYLANNAIVRQNLAEDGNRLWLNEYIGKELPKFTDFHGTSLWDPVNKKFVSFHSKEQFDAFKESGGKIVMVNKASAGRFGLQSNYIVVSAENAHSSNLPKFVMPYQGGGRRQYMKGTVFIKQGTKSVDDAGMLVYGSPRAITTSMNLKKAQKYAEECNRVIEHWSKLKEAGLKNHEFAAEMQRFLDTAGFKEFNVTTYEDLKELVDSKFITMDKDMPVAALEDGKSYVYGDKTIRQIGDMTTRNYDDMLEVATIRETYNNHRGVRLDSIDGGKAKLTGALDMFDKAVDRAAKMNTIGETERWYARTFDRNFRNIIPASENPYGRTALDLLKNVNIDISKYNGADKKLARAAKRFQQKYFIMATTPSKLDRKITSIMNAIVGDLVDWMPAMSRTGWTYQHLYNANPHRWATALQFYVNMGLLCTPQLLKQSLGVMSTMAKSPVKTAQAVMAYPFLRLAYIFKDNPGVISSCMKNAVKLAGISTDDFNMIMKVWNDASSLKASSFSPMLVAKYSRFLNSPQTAFAKLNRLAMLPTDIGNNFVMGVSDAVAVLERKSDDIASIISRSADLQDNMTRVGMSDAQRNLPMLMQWTSYPIRVTESLFNKRLKPGERAGLMLEQLGMWGVAGALGMSEGTKIALTNVAEDYLEVTPKDCKMFLDGIVPSILGEYGYTMNEGLRLSELVTKWTRIFSDAERSSFYEIIPSIKSAIDLARASGEVFTKEENALSILVDLISPDTSEGAKIHALKLMGTSNRTPSGLKRLAQSSLMGFYTHQLYDKNLDIVKNNTTLRDAIANIVGFNFVEREQIYAAKNVLYDREADIKKVVDAAEEIYQKMQTISLSRREDPERAEVELSELQKDLSSVIGVGYEALVTRYPNMPARDLYNRLNASKFLPKDTLSEILQKVYKSVGPEYIEYIQQ